MNIKDLSPKAEPSIWAMIIASVIAALGSYGLNITDELGQLLMLIGPYVLGFIFVRFAVFAPDTVKAIQEEAYVAGLPPSDPKPELPTPPGGSETDTTPRPEWGIYNMDDDGNVVKEN